MRSIIRLLAIFIVLAMSIMTFLTGCGGSSGRESAGTLVAGPVEDTNGDGAGDEQDIPSTGDGTLSPIFQGQLGVPISKSSLGIIDPDPTGLNPCTDFDGDGISNTEEITSNQFTADYPMIVTRVSEPITMEIRVSETDSAKNYSETLTEEDIKNTREQTMDENHYTQANLKTTPVVVKSSSSENKITSNEYKLACLSKNKYASSDFSGITATKNSQIDISKSASTDFSTSTSSETTDFPDVDYVDNLDRSGTSLNEDSVQEISKNYKTSSIAQSSSDIGPNDGLVRASLFIKNATVNIPVRVSNIYCTLTFKTPAGIYLPIKTFQLKNEDWSEYEQDIYGGEEFGPFTIEITDLNTSEVKRALKNGYMPQIHVISYELSKVEDSNYDPGVDNLKIVEETAKGRTALIKIIGNDVRETYRVPAFDVETGDRLSPGISLKKALFNIYRDRIGSGEDWSEDREGAGLTVPDTGLKWKPGSPDSSEYTYTNNTTGNSWTMFETYIKKYRDEYNVEHRIETIKRIGDLTKYNPFDTDDNPSYNPNELLTKDEFFKMKYWVIYHNGRYFEGDINDPIWAGERYEIICVDIGEFNEHFETFSYTPLQSMSEITLNTNWNKSANEDQFDRATYFGKAVKGDVIHLELDLANTRMLFDQSVMEAGLGFGQPYQEFMDTDAYALDHGYAWFNFGYTFDSEDETTSGIPQAFTHKVYGGINNITVDIEESKLASEYDISIKNSSSYSKTVRVSASTLVETDGIYIISRKTLDIDGNSVGAIPAGSYTVQIIARGTAYGTSITKKSSSSRTEDIVATVYNATSAAPGVPTYTATNYTNKIEFQISEADNAEYYLIRYRGPFNYGYNNVPPDYITVRANAGYNVISGINPSYGTAAKLTSNEKNLTDPGVYEMHIFSVNANSLDANGDEVLANCTEAASGDNFILVNYEKYSEEKSYIPKQSTDYFDQRVVDLEVNFNDGSGWFTLKLSSNQNGDANRAINCIGTNYMNYLEQKYNIYFKPPTGDTYCSYNVFSGGRDEVDVYIRTVAKPEYRYTVWPKMSSSKFDYIDEAARYIYTNTASIETLPGGDIVQYWMENADTDSSNFESMKTDKIYSSDSNLTAVDENDFGIVTDGNDETLDFFFSPALYHEYSITACIEEDMVSDPATGLAKPSFKAVGTDTSIFISNLDYPQEVNSYSIYCIEGNHVGESVSTWGDPVVTTANSYEISSIAGQALGRYTYYTVCVVATSKGVASQLAYRLVRTAVYWLSVALDSPYNYINGSGYFMDSGYLTTSGGVPLANRKQFEYGMPLDGDQYGLFGGGANIWDTGTSGLLGSGKYLRMVLAGKNIVDTSGLGLIPLAMDLTSNISPVPVWDSVNSVWRQAVNIDPATGQFTLPRPAFWTTCDSTAAITNPVIGSHYNPIVRMDERSDADNKYWSYQSTRFGLGFTVHNLGRNTGGYIRGRIYPFDINDVTNKPDLSRGAISYWIKGDGGYRGKGDDTYVYQQAICYFGPSSYVQFLAYDPISDGTNNSYIYYVVNGAQIGATLVGVNTLYNIVIAWDLVDGFSDGNKFKFYVNGSLRFNSNYSMTVESIMSYIQQFYLEGYCYHGGDNYDTASHSSIDNIKIWSGYIDPQAVATMEYAATAQDALHPMYNSANGYKPDPAIQVGYHYMPE